MTTAWEFDSILKYSAIFKSLVMDPRYLVMNTREKSEETDTNLFSSIDKILEESQHLPVISKAVGSQALGKDLLAALQGPHNQEGGHRFSPLQFLRSGIQTSKDLFLV